MTEGRESRIIFLSISLEKKRCNRKEQNRKSVKYRARESEEWPRVEQSISKEELLFAIVTISPLFCYWSEDRRKTQLETIALLSTLGRTHGVSSKPESSREDTKKRGLEETHEKDGKQCFFFSSHKRIRGQQRRPWNKA